MDHVNRFSDPTVVGPGTWWITHMKAKDAINDEKINEFIDHMNFLAKNFSCKNCRKHINQYMETHPFEDLKNLRNDDGELIGMFKWTWLFHNAVNTRIHKPYVEWETAVEMFYEETEICSKNCEEAGEEEHENIQTLASEPIDRKSRLVQAYFMSVGIPKTLQRESIYI